MKSVVIVTLILTIPSVISYTKETSRAEADETKVVDWLTSQVGPWSRRFPPPDLESVCANVKVLDLNFDDHVKSALLARVLVELRWKDDRLAFEHMTANKSGASSHQIKLDKVVLDPDHIWVPDLAFWTSKYGEL